MAIISGFTSGYVCRHCWSTRTDTDCTCSVEQRTKRPGIPHSSGAKQPLHNSATVSFYDNVLCDVLNEIQYLLLLDDDPVVTLILRLKNLSFINKFSGQSRPFWASLKLL